MEFKKTSFKYFLTIVIPIATLCFIYFLQIYTPKKNYTAEKNSSEKTSSKKPSSEKTYDLKKKIHRGPPTPTPNPDGCEITGENGECIEAGSF